MPRLKKRSASQIRDGDKKRKKASKVLSQSVERTTVQPSSGATTVQARSTVEFGKTSVEPPSAQSIAGTAVQSVQKKSLQNTAVHCWSLDSGVTRVQTGSSTATSVQPSGATSTSGTAVQQSVDRSAIFHEHYFSELSPQSALQPSLHISTVDYFSVLLERQFDVHHGMYPPSYLHAKILASEKLSQDEMIPSNMFAVQIHFLHQHYVVSTQTGKVLTVYDSLPNSTRCQHLLPQIKLLYQTANQETFRLIYKIPQNQGSTSDCGFFAIANAYLVLKHQPPEHVRLDQQLLRQHLHACLQEGFITDFPVVMEISEDATTMKPTPRKSEQQINDNLTENTNHIESETLKLQDPEQTSLLTAYFEDQHIREQNKRHLSTVSQRQNTCREVKAEIQQILHREAVRKRKATSRKKKTSIENILDKEKDRERKKASTNKKTPIEKDLDKEKNRDSQRTSRKKKTPTEKNLDKEKDRERKQASTNKKTPIEKDLDKEKNRDSQRTSRKKKTPTEKNLDNEKDRERKKASTNKKTPIEKDLDKEKNRDSHRTSRKKKTPTEKNLDNEKDRERKKASTNKKTPIEKDLDKEKNMDSQRTSRKKKTPTEKNLDKEKDRERKQASTNKKTPIEKDLDKEKNRDSQRTSRKKKTPTEKNLDKEKDRERKQASTNKKTPIEKDLDKEKNRDSQRTSRKKKTPTEKNLDTEKDRERKQASTNKKTPIEKDLDKEKNRDSQRTSRKKKTPTEKNLDKEKDRKRKTVSKHSSDIHAVISDFKKTIKDGPTYSCISCCRLLYRRTVVRFNRNKYSSAEYLPLNTTSSDHEQQWICNQCHTAIKKNKLPPLSTLNGLSLQSIPAELKDLSSLELQLICKILPFMKIVSLHTGAQRGIKGQVVLVPSDISKVTTNLPRQTSNSQIITLSLKRRLSDKHPFHQQLIRPSMVNTALHYLQTHSPFYSDVVVNTQWEIQATESTVEENGTIVDSEDEVDEDNPPEVVEYLKQKSAINSSTCMQPIHGPDVSTKDILNLAPAEGQIPRSYLQQPNWEALAFPRLFPTGQDVYSSERQVKLTPLKYFNARLLHKDGRFAETSEYIFHALDIIERQALQNSVSITTRKAYHEDISAGQLKDSNRLLRLLNKDQVFTSFKNIRGTPQYWQQMQLDMLAKLRQLGPYTFFITGSAAEFHWPEIIQIVAKQYGTILTEEDVRAMDWNTKRSWLQRNPVTVARHVDYIFEQLWGKVILSGAHPVGEILNYDRRKEMQGRGTAHFHAAVHVKDAPKLDHDSDEVCVAFINKYVKCEIPADHEDKELHDLVLSRQVHHHTRTCKKNKTKFCRFGYPRPPSPSTLIARPPEGEESASAKQTASKIQAEVCKVLTSSELDGTVTLASILEKAQVKETDYISALQTAQRRTTVIMKRTPQETMVNNYNPHLLRALQSNMDIQYITNIWACIAYLTSYMCKPERTMSELMRKASKEAAEKNVRHTLKDIGNIFIKAREMSEHEAIGRILSMPFRSSNIDVLHIQTDPKPNRTQVLKPRKVLESMHDDDKDIYMTTKHDKYANRPDSLQELSLAEFYANYSLQSLSSNEEHHSDEDGIQCDYDHEQNSSTRVKSRQCLYLKNSMGKIYARTQPIVIRYHFVSKQTDRELYYHRLLILYLPWRNENELALNSSYEQKFESVKDRIVHTIQKYELYNEEVENILENFDPEEAAPEMWNEVGAQLQQEQQDLQERPPEIDFPFLDPDILENADSSELQTPRNRQQNTFTVSTTHFSSDAEFLNSVQKLNTEQRQLFDFMYKWATDFKLSTDDVTKPPPFHIFLSGGGGVGKTFTINTLYQGLVRALRTPGQDPTKPTVLMTASTGKAASNINGTTLHSAFALPVKEKGKKFQYKKPSMERLNTMRANYINLRIIIADEISMFGGTGLDHLHLALQEIFQNYTEPFAGLSILAVGDLLQLPPVGDRAIFQRADKGYEALSGSLWTKYFKILELTTIVRQKGDPVFAHILSKVRTGEMTDDDISHLNDLKQTDTENFPPDAVHIYLTNQLVASYNQQRLTSLPQPHVTVVAEDSTKDFHTNSTKVKVQTDNIYKTAGLPNTITVAKGARWMLTKNIDISDHLVNGIIGTIHHIDIPEQQPILGTLYVKFDNDIIGTEAKKSSPPNLKGTVPIKAVTARFSLAENCHVQVERRMFPGVLAYALTVHKAQGSTYDHMFADFDKPRRFNVQKGQAYTMLSRATSRNGIKLINFDVSDIKVNHSALNEIVRMRSESQLTCRHPFTYLPGQILVGHLNIRSLNLHLKDIKADPSLNYFTVLCMSETHITNHHHRLSIPGFTILTKPTKHGLAVCVKNTVTYKEIDFSTEDKIQIMGIALNYKKELPLLVVYKPPTMPVPVFVDSLEIHVENLLTSYHDVLIMGDFNMPLDNSLFGGFLSRHNLKQIVDVPTHILGATLDFIVTSLSTLETAVMPVPYSDHHFVCTSLC